MKAPPSMMPTLALLTGGLATRLRPLTETIPKAMVEVAGRPFIEHQLRLFKREGIARVVICAGYLAEQISDFVGDGRRFGLAVDYSLDGQKLLGTGGALRRSLPLLGPEFIVMYGDSYLDIRFAPVVEAFAASGKPALMTVFRNENRWDTSNVEFAEGIVRRYDKADPTPDMAYIDYGMGILKADVLRGLPADEPVDLVEVYQPLVHQGELAGFEVYRRFYEVGSPEGLAEADDYLSQKEN